MFGDVVAHLKVAVVSVALGVLSLAPAIVAYDAARFRGVRSEVNAVLDELLPDEKNPTELVKNVFHFNASSIYITIAETIRRDRYRRQPGARDYPSVWERGEANAVWGPFLRFHYTPSQMYGFELHVPARRGYGAGAFARAAYGKDLNSLSAEELECVRRFVAFSKPCTATTARPRWNWRGVCGTRDTRLLRSPRTLS